MGGTTSKRQLQEILTQITSVVSVESSQVQRSVFELSNAVTIEAPDPGTSMVPPRVMADNAGCVACTQFLDQVLPAYRALQLEWRDRFEPSFDVSEPTFAEAYRNVFSADDLNVRQGRGDTALGYLSAQCQAVCSPLYIDSINQQRRGVIQIDAVFNSSTVNDIVSNVQREVQQRLDSDIGAPEQLLDSLGAVFGTNSRTETEQRIENIIDTNIRQVVEQVSENDVDVSNRINISGYSLFVGDITQQSTIRFIGDFLAKSGAFNDILNEEETRLYQEQVDRANTLGDLAEQFERTVLGVAEEVGSAAQIASLAVIGMVAIALVVTAVVVFRTGTTVKDAFRLKQDVQDERARDRRLSAERARRRRVDADRERYLEAGQRARVQRVGERYVASQRSGQ